MTIILRKNDSYDATDGERKVPVENSLRKLVLNNGDFCFFNGWPDALVIKKDGTISFIEAKSATDKLTSNQLCVLTLLFHLGLDVRITDGNDYGRGLSVEEIKLGEEYLKEKYINYFDLQPMHLKRRGLSNWLNDAINEKVDSKLKEQPALSKDKPLVLTTSEVAHELRLHENTILKLAKENKIPHLIINRKYLFSRKEIEEFISNHKLQQNNSTIEVSK